LSQLTTTMTGTWKTATNQQRISHYRQTKCPHTISEATESEACVTATQVVREESIFLLA